MNLITNQKFLEQLECVLVWRWPAALSTRWWSRGERREERGEDEYRMDIIICHPSGELDSMYHPSAIIQIPE